VYSGLRQQRPALPAFLETGNSQETGRTATCAAACTAGGRTAGAFRSRARSQVNPFSYIRGELHVEALPLSSVAAQAGTPCYVYSLAALTDAYSTFSAAFQGHEHLVCYAVKANSNLAVLDIFGKLGSGFDIVSGGELTRVLRAGGDPSKIVFSGVGKSADDIRTALQARILCFNVESEGELDRIEQIAGSMGVIAPISLRVNPDVDAGTHPYIATGLKQNKFGIPYATAPLLYEKARALPHIRVTGIDCHIGSQLTDLEPVAEALSRIRDLVTTLEHSGIALEHIDVGGGIGIRYRDEKPPPVADYARVVLGTFDTSRHRLLFEPGRMLTGNAGVLLTRIEYVKRGEERNFAIVDAAMNDLMRPALYDAWHDIRSVEEHGTIDTYDVVGPVCESGDFLGRARRIAASQGALLAVMSAGAYAMSMASNYNSRPRAAEVIVDRDRLFIVRDREQVHDLIERERCLPRDSR
jgi:diaminopimelate decarboxylase